MGRQVCPKALAQHKLRFGAQPEFPHEVEQPWVVGGWVVGGRAQLELVELGWEVWRYGKGGSTRLAARDVLDWGVGNPFLCCSMS